MISPHNRVDLAAFKHDLAALARPLGVEPRPGAHHCCLHEDAHKSLSVYQTERGDWRWRCHSCNMGGDLVDALALRAGVSSAEVIRGLRDRAALPFTARAVVRHNPTPALPERPGNLESEGAAAVAFRDDLNADEGALAYLWRRRGIGPATVLSPTSAVTEKSERFFDFFSVHHRIPWNPGYERAI